MLLKRKGWHSHSQTCYAIARCYSKTTMMSCVQPAGSRPLDYQGMSCCLLCGRVLLVNKASGPHICCHISCWPRALHMPVVLFPAVSCPLTHRCGRYHELIAASLDAWGGASLPRHHSQRHRRHCRGLCNQQRTQRSARPSSCVVRTLSQPGLLPLPCKWTRWATSRVLLRSITSRPCWGRWSWLVRWH